MDMFYSYPLDGKLQIAKKSGVFSPNLRFFNRPSVYYTGNHSFERVMH